MFCFYFGVFSPKQNWKLLIIGDMQKQGAVESGQCKGGRGVVTKGWTKGRTKGGQRVGRGAPSGPEICRVGAKTAFFAPRGPRDGPLGALSSRGRLNVGRRQSGVGLDIEGPGRTWHHRRAWATMSYVSAC